MSNRKIIIGKNGEVVDFKNSITVGSSQSINLPKEVLDLTANTSKLAGLSKTSILTIINAFMTMKDNLLLQLADCQREKKQAESQTTADIVNSAIGAASLAIKGWIASGIVGAIFGAVKEIFLGVWNEAKDKEEEAWIRKKIFGENGPDSKGDYSNDCLMGQLERLDKSICELTESIRDYNFIQTDLDEIKDRLSSALELYTGEKLIDKFSSYEYVRWARVGASGRLVLGDTSVSASDLAEAKSAGSTAHASLVEAQEATVITRQLDSDTVGKVKRVSTLGSIRGNDIY